MTTGLCQPGARRPNCRAPCCIKPVPPDSEDDEPTSPPFAKRVCTTGKELFAKLEPAHSSLGDVRSPVAATVQPLSSSQQLNHNKKWRHIRQRYGVMGGFALAENWMPSDDLRGMLAMEKFDGIRVIWDGKHAHFRTRNDTRYEVPPDIRAQLPDDIRLDGEIWAGRGCFEQTLSLLRSKKWANLSFVVFDAPDAGGGFIQRLETARSQVSARMPASQRFAQVADAQLCEDEPTVKRLLLEVERKKGEGLILRRADSRFRAGGGSRDLLKVKSWWTSTAKVLRDNVHHNGRSSLRCEDLERSLGQEALTFDLPWNRTALPPPVGALVEYKYQGGLQGGFPRFPKFVRLVSSE